MSQSLEQRAPPQGEQAWQRLPARGTQPVPAWLPRLPTFPRCHPLCPLPRGQQPSSAQGSWHRERMPFPHHPWVPRLLECLTTSNQGAPRRVNMASGQKEPRSAPYLLAGLLQSWADWALRHPGSPQPPPQGAGTELQPVAPEAVWRPPAPVLDTLEEGLLSWVTAGSLHSCQSCCCLQPCSFPSTPLLGSTQLHPSPSPCRQAAPFAGISFNLKQVPGIPALAESTLPPTRPLPRRLLPCLFMEVESAAQGSCLTQIPTSWEADTIQRESWVSNTDSISKFTRSHITTVVIDCGPPTLILLQDSVISSHLDPQPQ